MRQEAWTQHGRHRNTRKARCSAHCNSVLTHRILLLRPEQPPLLPCLCSRLICTCPKSLLNPALVARPQVRCLQLARVPKNTQRHNTAVFCMCGSRTAPPEQVLSVHLPQCTDLLVGHLHHGDCILQIPVEPRVCSGSAGCIGASGCRLVRDRLRCQGVLHSTPDGQARGLVARSGAQGGRTGAMPMRYMGIYNRVRVCQRSQCQPLGEAASGTKAGTVHRGHGGGY